MGEKKKRDLITNILTHTQFSHIMLCLQSHKHAFSFGFSFIQANPILQHKLVQRQKEPQKLLCSTVSLFDN